MVKSKSIVFLFAVFKLNILSNNRPAKTEGTQIVCTSYNVNQKSRWISCLYIPKVLLQQFRDM